MRVSTTSPGARVNVTPVIRALPDGHVYLLYQSNVPASNREIRFNRSSDFGLTWQPADAVLRAIDDRVRAGVADGVRMVRVLGHLGWEQPGWPAERDILSLEARVTEAVRKFPSVVLCAYDVRRLSGRRLLLGGLECHPVTLRRAALRPNEHYVGARTFLERLAVDAPDSC